MPGVQPALAPGIPRARAELLCDAGTFRPVRSAVGDGVTAGAGRLHGRPVHVWSQDGGFRGGSLGAAGGETIARTVARAAAARAPVVGFLHSGGARLQEGAAGLHAYAAIFRAQALAAVPQVAVVCGPCAGGAAYSPALGDITVMAGPSARLFLTGPRVVEEVTRERLSAEELGGPRVHARTGVAHLQAEDDVAAIDLARDALAHLPSAEGEALPLAPPAPPRPGDPAAPVPAQTRRVYDVREVAARLLDGGRLLELAPRWARNLVVGLARLDGRPVGLVASQPRHLGGVLDAAGAEKGAWFVGLCDRFGLPLVVLVDTPGFLPGAAQERSGVIRHGAALLRAFARARVPRVTVTLRQAYGGAHIVMNARDLGATLTLAWPGAAVGVMGPRQARAVLGSDAMPDAGVAAAAADGYIDEVIEPAETRGRLLEALEAAR